MKKLLILFTFAIFATFSFSDVYAEGEQYTEQDYFEIYGNYLKDLGLIKGDSNGNLNQNSNLSRAEAVVIILRTLGEEDQAKMYPINIFSDVAENAWYAPYVNYAAQKGIVNGVGNGAFAPQNNVTIKQLFTLFLRANGYSADWATENIVAKAAYLGMTDNLADTTIGDEDALRGDAFIIFGNSIEIPKNAAGYDSYVLQDVLAKKSQSELNELTSKYDFLNNFITADNTVVTDNSNSLEQTEQSNPKVENKDEVKVADKKAEDNSNQTEDNSQQAEENTQQAEENSQQAEDESPQTSEANEQAASTLEFVKSEKGESINIMNLWFNELLDFHDFDDNGCLKVVDVRGDYGEYTKEWFLDRKNYMTGTTDKKAYVRYNDGSASVDLQGLTFTVEYNVKQRDGKGTLKGKTTISFPATANAAGSDASASNSNSNDAAKLSFDRIEAGAINVINLWFTDKLDYNNLGTVGVVSVSGDYGEYDEAWFLDSSHYTVGTTDKKVYLRYNDGSASVNLNGLKFKVKYDVKAREKDARCQGEVNLDFNYQK